MVLLQSHFNQSGYILIVVKREFMKIKNIFSILLASLI